MWASRGVYNKHDAMMHRKESIMIINQTLTFDCGKGVSFAVTPEQVEAIAKHESAIAHVIQIGLKNILQDSHASITYESFKTETECQEAKRKRAGEKLEALLAGDVRTARAGGSSKVDSFTTWARRVVLKSLSKEKRKELAESDDKGVAYLDAVYAKNESVLKPRVEAAIAADIAERAAAAELANGLDLDI
jgi:hypothetical protein